MKAPKVLTGLEQCVADDFRAFQGRRVGLLANPASVDHRYRHLIDLAKDAGLEIVRVFGPEHGLGGTAQDLEAVADVEKNHPRWGVPVISLYGADESSLTPKPEHLADLNVLLVDLPDIGTRFYTFAATMIRTMRVAAGKGLKVVVLDRPNPLGGVRTEGPGVSDGFRSFVGEIDLPIRHGLTLAEIASKVKAIEKLDVDLAPIPCEGWSRQMLFPETGLPWLLPSPNMPTFDTALVYPGGCLIEGTNLSEGRGTTRPFEIIGAPWLSEVKLADSLNSSGLRGFYARPLTFKPTFQKHEGKICAGVQIHVTDPTVFQPVRVYSAAIIAARAQNPEKFRWRTEVYEFRTDPIAIDLLFGSSRERKLIESGATWHDLADFWTDDQGPDTVEFN
ncbi:DUF1343 domain-containing protein [bacterium]|nr:DUF1343 domain-containing protein [bacterium]